MLSDFTGIKLAGRLFDFTGVGTEICSGHYYQYFEV